MISFATFLENAKLLAFPHGEAENLSFNYRVTVANALIELQSFVPCLRNNNIDFLTREAVIDHCGVATGAAPQGVITAIYAFKPGEACLRYFYTQRSTSFIQCLVDQYKCRAESDPRLPDYLYLDYILNGGDVCEFYVGDDAEDDEWFTCSTERYFAIGPNRKIFLAPRIPCEYVVAVHYEGIKRKWEDTDLIVEDQDVLNAVAMYLKRDTAAVIDADNDTARSAGALWSKAIADIGWRCREETAVRKSHECLSGMDDVSQVWSTIYTDNPYA